MFYIGRCAPIRGFWVLGITTLTSHPTKEALMVRIRGARSRPHQDPGSDAGRAQTCTEILVQVGHYRSLKDKRITGESREWIYGREGHAVRTTRNFLARFEDMMVRQQPISPKSRPRSEASDGPLTESVKRLSDKRVN